MPALPGQFLTVRVRPDRDRGAAAAHLLAVGRSGHRELPDQRQARAARRGQRVPARSSLRVGDVIEAGAPRGSFVLRPGDRPVVLISAGVGATPVLAMLHVLAAAALARPVWWLHGARNGAEHPFAEEARGLLAQLPTRTGSSATAARAGRSRLRRRRDG